MNQVTHSMGRAALAVLSVLCLWSIPAEAASLAWDGGAVDFMDPANESAMAFTKTFHRAVEDALKAAGWPLGRDSLREDLRVGIGENRIIFVHGADGAPIG